jgi:hypothetical protein
MKVWGMGVGVVVGVGAAWMWVRCGASFLCL